MIWVALSYIPANVWSFLFATGAIIGVIQEIINVSDGKIELVRIILSMIAFLAAIIMIRRRIEDRRKIKAIRKAVKKVCKSRPEKIPREIGIGWLVEHLLRMRTSGIVVTAAMVMCAVFLYVEYVFIHYSISAYTLLGLLAVAQLTWPLAGLLVRAIGQCFGNRILSIIASVMLAMVIVPVWYEFVRKDIAGAVVLLTISAVFPPVGAIFLGIPLLALKLLIGSILIGQPIGTERGNPVASSVVALSREKMSWYSEGLKKKSPYYDTEKTGILIKVLEVIAVLFLCAGVVLAILLGIINYALSFLACIPLLIFHCTWEFSRRLRLRTADDVLASDSRPPVLLLRSFADDGIAAKAKSLIISNSKVLEVVTTWCSDLGPVFAFGRPGEFLADAGPPRMYVDNSNWQSKIIRYMGEARLIVLMVGKTDSLAWEVQQIIDRNLLHKTIFVLPPQRPHVLEARWEKLRQCFSKEHSRYMQAINPAAALVIGFEKGRPFSITSKSHNTLAYDIAFKALVTAFKKSRPVQASQPGSASDSAGGGEGPVVLAQGREHAAL